MKRQIKAKLIHWKNKKTRKPLLLQGARQVGKTYVLQDFAKSQFGNSHYFDLEELKTDLSSIFNDSSLDPKQLIDNIIPVEVKAGINTKAKSLLAFINKYSPVYSVKFTGNKFGCDRRKRIFNYPLYMILKFPELSTKSVFL